MPNATIEPQDYGFLCKLVQDRAGIVLGEGKEYLVDTRLTPVARQEKLDSIGELVRQLRSAPFNGLHQKVIEAMTTNETFFFRDIHPFEALRTEIFPRLLQQRAAFKTVNIWCGACSSGQEPYSIAITAKEFSQVHPGWPVRIVASDISAEMVARASEARYNQLEINRGLPAQHLVKHFEKQGLVWHLKDEIRNSVRFLRMNLLETWPPLPLMDVIFLRNVLIYFDVETKKSILAQIRRQMTPDGFLFLGGAETTLYLDDAFGQVCYGKAPCCRLRPL